VHFLVKKGILTNTIITPAAAAVLHLSSCLSIISQIQSAHIQCKFNTDSFFCINKFLYNNCLTAGKFSIISSYSDNIIGMRTTNKIYFSWVLNVQHSLNMSTSIKVPVHCALADYHTTAVTTPATSWRAITCRSQSMEGPERSKFCMVNNATTHCYYG